jgi:undecaprenyl-diphosphatase
MEELKSKRSVRAFIKKLPFKFLMIAGSFLASLFLFGFITHEVIIEKEDLFDTTVIRFFSPYTTEPFVNVMKIFTFFGSGTFLIPAYSIIVYFLLIQKHKILAIHIAIVATTGTALSYTAKRIFQRARPDLPLVEALKTYSFPSGHALSSFIFCGILVYLLWKAEMRPVWKWILSILLFLFSVTIGISRILLKAHHPTDVLAGFCLGFVWVILSFFLLNKIQSSRRR